MNTKYLLLQGLLLTSVLVNLFIDANLFFKILLICLLFLYGLLILTEFKYNRERYLFSASGFVIISILFLIARYTTGTTFIVFLFCFLVLFIYLSRVLFSRTFGVVLESNTKETKVKIRDEFFSFGKVFKIKSTTKFAKGALVLIELDKTVFRKPFKVIKQLEGAEIKTIKALVKSKKASKSNKITKKRTATNKKKK